MALIQRLDLRQGQSLVMTPQLQQAIKLLQMSNFELQAFVESELERNPLLERDDKTEATKTEAAPEKFSSEHQEEGQSLHPSELRELRSDQQDVVNALQAEGSQANSPESLDTDLENLYTHEARADTHNREASGIADSGWTSLRSTGGISLEGEEYNFGSTLSSPPTLAEHLTAQLNLHIFNPADQLIGQHLIGMVNEAGYLTASPEDIAGQLGTTAFHINEILEILKAFEPTGVFAANLQECLALQLRERNRFDPAMALLVANLPLVARHDLVALRQVCHVDSEDIREMIAEIKTLNPKPGHAFGSEVIQPVIPDIFVRLDADGSWLIELNNDTLPRVLINNQYMEKISPRKNSEQDMSYLTACQASANWLVKSLDQRAKTILKVAREIVRQQDAFLIHGIQHLKPINLKTVADAIEMHESTVSRVTANKYMATPRGTFELKYFFTQAISATEDGAEMHSAESVRQRIRQLVGAETADTVLSDDTLVDLLRQDGIEIARRTVAKYRESLHIPSSVQRRRQNRLA